MVFNSIQFVFFLLIVVILYNILSAKMRGYWLLICGYSFYAFYGLSYIIWLGGVTVFSYFGAWWISNCSKSSKKLTAITVSVISVLSFLLFFKYTDFAISVINDIQSSFGCANINLLQLMVPVGISFYTFVAIGYLFDVFRGKVNVETNFIRYALFISYFPTILSGPIERSATLLSQLSSLRHTSYENARMGFVCFLYGLFFKVVLADRLALCSDCVFSDVHSFRGISLLVASIAFSLQIYFDFAGYTYMAIGVSRLFNISLNNNFNKPYLAVSLTDFWRRWHISLTSWFRDYLYIPLGGNRVCQLRWVVNILVVFIVSGLWHGAAYTFVVWGVIHAIAQIVEKYSIHDKFIRTGINRGRSTVISLFRVLFTFCIVSAAWIFFRSSSLEDAMYILKGVFTLSDYSIMGLFVESGTNSLFGLTFFDTILAIFFVTIVLLLETFVGDISDGLAVPVKLLHLPIIPRWGGYILLSIIILLFGKLGVSEFVYFNF